MNELEELSDRIAAYTNSSKWWVYNQIVKILDYKSPRPIPQYLYLTTTGLRNRMMCLRKLFKEKIK